MDTNKSKIGKNENIRRIEDADAYQISDAGLQITSKRGNANSISSKSQKVIDNVMKNESMNISDIADSVYVIRDELSKEEKAKHEHLLKDIDEQLMCSVSQYLRECEKKPVVFITRNFRKVWELSKTNKWTAESQRVFDKKNRVTGCKKEILQGFSSELRRLIEGSSKKLASRSTKEVLDYLNNSPMIEQMRCIKNLDNFKKIFPNESWPKEAVKNAIHGFKERVATHREEILKKLSKYKANEEDFKLLNEIKSLGPKCEFFVDVEPIENGISTFIESCKELNRQCTKAQQCTINSQDKLEIDDFAKCVDTVEKRNKTIVAYNNTWKEDSKFMSEMSWFPLSSAQEKCSEMINNYMEGIVNSLKEVKEKWKTNDREVTSQIYKTIKVKYSVVDFMTEMKSAFPNGTTVLESCKSELQEHFNELKKTTDLSIESVTSTIEKCHFKLKKDRLTSDNDEHKEILQGFDILNGLLHSFRAAREASPRDTYDFVDARELECKDKLTQKINDVADKWDGSDTQLLCLRLLTLQTFIDLVTISSLDNIIDTVLRALSSTDFRLVKECLAHIKYIDVELGPKVRKLQDYHRKLFQKVATVERYVKTCHIGINTAEELLEKESLNTGIDFKVLKELFENYFEHWRENYENHKIDNVVTSATRLRHNKKIKNRDIVNLVASLFSVWSISETTQDSDSDSGSDDDDSDDMKTVVRPHLLQVIAVFRMLGLGIKQDKTKDGSFEEFLDEPFELQNIPNHLLEMLTGEGKSIVIAIVGAVFAVLGYTVHCMCYSAYLCKRDTDAFERLFSDFDIRGRISWDTFENRFETILEGVISRERITAAIETCGVPKTIGGV